MHVLAGEHKLHTPHSGVGCGAAHPQAFLLQTLCCRPAKLFFLSSRKRKDDYDNIIIINLLEYNLGSKDIL
jgi:hypothetical protein